MWLREGDMSIDSFWKNGLNNESRCKHDSVVRNAQLRVIIMITIVIIVRYFICITDAWTEFTFGFYA